MRSEMDMTTICNNFPPKVTSSILYRHGKHVEKQDLGRVEADKSEACDWCSTNNIHRMEMS